MNRLKELIQDELASRALVTSRLPGVPARCLACGASTRVDESPLYLTCDTCGHLHDAAERAEAIRQGVDVARDAVLAAPVTAEEKQLLRDCMNELADATYTLVATRTDPAVIVSGLPDDQEQLVPVPASHVAEANALLAGRDQVNL